MEHRFDYEWSLADAKFTKDKGKVFSCFACGGGSTMGYKLAGFDVVGNNDIDKRMTEVYRANHNPKYTFLESITTFSKRKDLPKELYNLDILDGSPPCSSFSTAGNREKDWGKEKKFREGQAEQVLDTLFFDFIDLAKELQPKVVVAENVSGMLMGKAKEYVKKIYTEFKKSGYDLKIKPYLLDASNMGVPQKRKRVFFIALRNDLSHNFNEYIDMFQTAPKLNLKFTEKNIYFKDVQDININRAKLPQSDFKHWDNSNKNGRSFETKNKTKFGFFYKALGNLVCSTIDTSSRYAIEESKHLLSDSEFIKVGSFPLDYNFIKNNPQYLIGMSVPPIMIAQISTEIYNQWLKHI